MIECVFGLVYVCLLVSRVLIDVFVILIVLCLCVLIVLCSVGLLMKCFGCYSVLYLMLCI